MVRQVFWGDWANGHGILVCQSWDGPSLKCRSCAWCRFRPSCQPGRSSPPWFSQITATAPSPTAPRDWDRKSMGSHGQPHQSKYLDPDGEEKRGGGGGGEVCRMETGMEGEQLLGPRTAGGKERGREIGADVISEFCYRYQTDTFFNTYRDMRRQYIYSAALPRCFSEKRCHSDTRCTVMGHQGGGRPPVITVTQIQILD